MEGAGGTPSYPNARYVFSQVEFDYWRKGENIGDARKANRDQFMKVAVPFGDKATFLKPARARWCRASAPSRRSGIRRA